jgi:hypothetical protein
MTWTIVFAGMILVVACCIGSLLITTRLYKR